MQELKKMLPSLVVYNFILLLAIGAVWLGFGFDYRLLTGLLLGNALMLLNFYFIGFTARKVSQTRSFKRGQFLANLSYGIRYIGMFAVLALFLAFDLISLFTAVIPLFYTKIYYTVGALTGRYDDD